jgi:hypothetical protein
MIARRSVLGHDSPTHPFLLHQSNIREPSMSRYVAPLGFTLAAVWVAVIFFLVSAH